MYGKTHVLKGIITAVIVLALLSTGSAVGLGNRGNEAERTQKTSTDRASPDHMLLSEVCVTPTPGEFVEIYNPTENGITLTDYYLADIIDYYNIVDPALGFPSGSSTYDFVVSFPSGSSINADSAQTVAMNSSDFKGEYGFAPDYCLSGTDAPLMESGSGFIGSSAGLTNSHETVVLFEWDGTSDLVKDADIVWWGDDDGYKVDKTGVSMDSDTDGDGVNTSYKTDASSYPPVSANPHLVGNSFKREGLTEAGETGSGGNGITGHDETTEDLTSSWADDAAANPGTGPAQGTGLSITDVRQNPGGDPVPGTDITVTANVTDDGSVNRVNISISLNGGTPANYAMSGVGGNKYSHTIVYNSPPMETFTEVTYNISATDDEGNKAYSANHTYYYLPASSPVLNITEVMFNHTRIGENWIELYCSDDGNGGEGNSLVNWALDDLDSGDEKSFKNSIVRTGEVVLVHFNDTETSDEMNTGDGNEDGVLDVYTAYGSHKLNVYSDQVVLRNDSHMIVDAVVWAYDDEMIYGSEQGDLDFLADIGQWNSNGTSDCVDAELVNRGYSIARTPGEPDTDSKVDWHIEDTPGPGIFSNLSDAKPIIADIVLEPEPVKGMVDPMKDLTVTAKIMDDRAIVSANITWSLDEVDKGNIPLADDGGGEDAVPDDGNWTGTIPGQGEGTEAEFWVEAFDTAFQSSKSKSIAVGFGYPSREAQLLITEVMFAPRNGNDAVEIKCVDDGNNGNGIDLNKWYLNDMDGDVEYEFGESRVKSGEYVLLHFNDDANTSENVSDQGNGDGIIDIYTTASNNVLSRNGDQFVLFDADDMAVDAVAWQSGGALDVHERDDVAALYAWNMWSEDTAEGCVAVPEDPSGKSLARKINISREDPRPYTDSNDAEDWFVGSKGTPGTPPELTVDISFTVLTGEPITLTPKDEFAITWEMTGGEMLKPLVNLSLYYFEGSVGGLGSLLAYPDPFSEEFLWDLTDLSDGTYYLQLRWDDTLNPVGYSNTSLPMEIVSTVPPRIIGTKPSNASTDVDVASKIVLFFDKVPDITTFRPGDTFLITPSLTGGFSVDGNNVTFTPDTAMEYNTTYEITVKDIADTDGEMMREIFTFNFTTRGRRTFILSGEITPGNATVTIDGKEIEVMDGRIRKLLINGTYELEVALDGYEPYLKIVNISGADVSLVEEDAIVLRKIIRIGPFIDDGGGLKGVRVRFEVDGEKYDELTDEEGYATFAVPGGPIPEGTVISADFEGESIDWKWDSEKAPYDSFKTKAEDGNTALWVVLIILIVLIIAVALAMVIYLVRAGGDGSAETPSEDGGASHDRPPSPSTTEAAVISEEMDRSGGMSGYSVGDPGRKAPPYNRSGGGREEHGPGERAGVPKPPRTMGGNPRSNIGVSSPAPSHTMPEDGAKAASTDMPEALREERAASGAPSTGESRGALTGEDARGSDSEVPFEDAIPTTLPEEEDGTEEDRRILKELPGTASGGIERLALPEGGEDKGGGDERRGDERRGDERRGDDSGDIADNDGKG